MPLKRSDEGRSLFARCQADQPDDPAVLSLMEDGELAEVLVQRDENLSHGVSSREDRVVARVVLPFGDTLHLVTGSLEQVGSAARDATIEQQAHRHASGL